MIILNITKCNVSPVDVGTLWQYNWVDVEFSASLPPKGQCNLFGNCFLEFIMKSKEYFHGICDRGIFLSLDKGVFGSLGIKETLDLNISDFRQGQYYSPRFNCPVGQFNLIRWAIDILCTPGLTFIFNSWGLPVIISMS